MVLCLLFWTWVGEYLELLVAELDLALRYFLNFAHPFDFVSVNGSQNFVNFMHSWRSNRLDVLSLVCKALHTRARNVRT